MRSMCQISRNMVIGGALCWVMLPVRGLAAEPLTWEDCLREAGRNHPDLVAAREGVVQKEAARTIARSVFWPQITANGSAAATDTTSVGSAESFSAGISGSLLIFDGGKTPREIRSARETLQAAREQFRYTSAEVRYRLRAAFIALWRAQENAALAADIETLRQGNLDLISLRYSAGTEHRGALLSAQASAVGAGEDVQTARRALTGAREGLVRETGLPFSEDMAVAADVAVPFPGTEGPDMADLLEKVPSVQQAAARERAAWADAGAARSDRWPEIALTGETARSGNVWVPGERGSSVGFRVSVPLFEGGAVTARITQSQSVARQRQAETRAARDAAQVALGDAWRNWATAAADVGVREQFLAAAEERVRIARQQYSVGLVGFDDWTIIEDALVTAKRALLEARSSALLAEAAWVRAKGGTLEYEDR